MWISHDWLPSKTSGLSKIKAQPKGLIVTGICNESLKLCHLSECIRGRCCSTLREGSQELAPMTWQAEEALLGFWRRAALRRPPKAVFRLLLPTRPHWLSCLEQGRLSSPGRVCSAVHNQQLQLMLLNVVLRYLHDYR